jgi:hypothetical protein
MPDDACRSEPARHRSVYRAVWCEACPTKISLSDSNRHHIEHRLDHRPVIGHDVVGAAAWISATATRRGAATIPAWTDGSG